MEVFDRGADFDPRLDPIVRVEASRLRARLLKYYEAAGTETDSAHRTASGSLHSRLPPRNSRAATGAAPAASFPSRPLRPKSNRLWPLACGSGLIASGVALLWFGRAAATRTPFTNFTEGDERAGAVYYSDSFADGRTIVYARYDGGTWDLYLRQIGSLEVRNLTSGSKADNTQPAFSPTGRKSLSEASGTVAASSYGFVSGAVRRIVNSGYYPAWSPAWIEDCVFYGHFR